MSMGTDEAHLGFLRGLSDIVAKPFLIVFQKSWWSGEVPNDGGVGGKKQGSTHFLRRVERAAQGTDSLSASLCVR